MSDAQELLVFNGINAVDGSYLTQATSKQLAAAAAGETLTAEEAFSVKELIQRHTARFSQRINADTRDLSATGWGVIFGALADPRIRAALLPLLNLRRDQAGPLYREFSGPAGYRPHDTKRSFSGRHSAPAFGPVDPQRLPYYLLLVGDPNEIPYSFQYQLDVQYAVGRLHFDTIEEYASYARSVVAAETSMPPFPRRASFFAVRNEGDPATEASADYLLKPLAETTLPTMFGRIMDAERRRAESYRLQANETMARQSEARIRACMWQLELLYASDASRANLLLLLGAGGAPPPLLFAASHGMAFPNGHPLQLSDQGALLCQDWPGPRHHQGPIPPAFYATGNDIADDACLLGTMQFFFACYGAGTPQYDQFAHATGKPEPIAPYAFLAALPRRLLSHPAGGSLAVVGHVERAWGYSFLWDQQQQLRTFEDAFSYLLVDGQPIGAAVEWFNERYAEIAAELSRQIEEYDLHQNRNPRVEQDVARLWTANNDARGYVILGDPAVRLKLADAAIAGA